jgi:hypothetical protein
VKRNLESETMAPSGKGLILESSKTQKPPNRGSFQRRLVVGIDGIANREQQNYRSRDKKFDPAGCFPDCLGNSLI